MYPCNSHKIYKVKFGLSEKHTKFEKDFYRNTYFKVITNVDQIPTYFRERPLMTSDDF